MSYQLLTDNQIRTYLSCQRLLKYNSEIEWPVKTVLLRRTLEKTYARLVLEPELDIVSVLAAEFPRACLNVFYGTHRVKLAMSEFSDIPKLISDFFLELPLKNLTPITTGFVHRIMLNKTPVDCSISGAFVDASKSVRHLKRSGLTYVVFLPEGDRHTCNNDLLSKLLVSELQEVSKDIYRDAADTKVLTISLGKDKIEWALHFSTQPECEAEAKLLGISLENDIFRPRSPCKEYKCKFREVCGYVQNHQRKAVPATHRKSRRKDLAALSDCTVLSSR